MSNETARTLNTEVLVGFAALRGNAWHYAAAMQGDEPNHYDGAIPIADVRRRLLSWEVQEIQAAGVLPDGTVILDPSRKSFIRSDTHAFLDTMKSSRKLHGYAEWLVDTGAALDLSVGSAGMLRGGAQMWVSWETPENLTTPEGVEYRPNIVTATSCDGSLASIVRDTITRVVCDNTLAAGMSEDEGGMLIRTRHTKFSTIDNHLSGFDRLAVSSDAFAAEVKALCETEVSDAQWSAFVQLHFPEPVNDSKRGQTVMEKNRENLTGLYKGDPRVAPYTGTAFGVMQAVNTFDQHLRQMRNGNPETAGVDRKGRNLASALSGKLDADTSAAAATLALVLA